MILKIIKNIYKGSLLEKGVLEIASIYGVSHSEMTELETIKDTGINISRSLAFIALFTIIFMTCYEAAKQFYFPVLTLWQSHIITILFSGAVAPIASYFALKRIEILSKRLLKELNENKKLSNDLIAINNSLEIRVNERTAELVSLNSLLSNEVEQRKNAEQELRNQTEILKSKNTLLNIQNEQLAILNNKLLSSQQKLSESLETKNFLFSIIAHDLRSPFNTLLGTTKMLECDFEEFELREIKEITKSINSSSQNIYKLLENLLHWSMLQTNKITFSPIQFNIEIIIYDIYNLYKESIINKNITVILPHNKDINVTADKDMIELVIRNLLSNAIKYTPINGKITIYTMDNDTSFALSVEDSGMGMDEDRLKILFTKNIKSTLGTNKETGTGLGLQLCKEFIELHKGELLVNSKKGLGTTFTFSIPKTYNQISGEIWNQS